MDYLQQDKVNNYIQLYNTLRNKLKWKAMDSRALMAMAFQYVMHDQQLDIDRLLQIADTLKRQATLFSPLKGQSSFTMAAFLDTNFDDPHDQVENLFHTYDAFKKEKFQSGIFTYIAASILVKNGDKDAEAHEIILKTKKIYQGMKKEHAFLTSNSDYPLATLLAYEQHVDVIRQIEVYYDGLHKEGFRKGNDLQFLSHILALDKDENEHVLIERSVHIFDQFKKEGIKPKPTYYPVIGMLALLPQDTVQIQDINHIYQRLNNEKHFKWQKDTNLIMAASFFAKDQLKHPHIAETSIYTTIEMIIQAQQAVMIAAMASASNGSNANQ